MMTSRERIKRALIGEQVDRIPWTPLIDGYYLSTSNKTNQVDAIKGFGGDVLARHIPTFKNIVPLEGLAPMAFGSLGNEVLYSGREVTQSLVGEGDIRYEMSEHNGEIEQRIVTPVGTLQSKARRTDHSPFIPFPKEHLIKSLEDIKTYQYVVEHTKYEAFYDLFKQEDAYIGDAGIASTSGPTSPFHFLLDEIGIEKFYFLLMDYESALEDLMDIMHEKNLEVYNIIARSPAEIVIDYENTSTTTLSPAMYEKYCLTHINDYADIMHRSNKIFLTHMCGKLKMLENQMRMGRMDGIIDIAPPPTGDVPLDSAKAMWGDKKVVMGGIDPTVFKMSDQDQLAMYIKDIIQSLAGQTGVLIGSADATPMDTPIENLQLISYLIQENGTYSLLE